MGAGSRQTALRRAAAAAGSIRLGVVLIGLIVLYLTAASTAPRSVARLLGAEADSPYSHWVAICLWAALCLNIAAATVFRIRPDRAQLGAIGCHAGVLLLAAGTAWYVAAGASGRCVSHLTGDGWSEIERLYSNGAACYVSAAPDVGAAFQTPLPLPTGRGDEPRIMNSPLAGAPAGVEIRAAEFLPRTRLMRRPEDGRLVPSPASDDDGALAGAALRVELLGADWRLTTYLPFAPTILPEDWDQVDLPGGGSLHLAFGRASLALGGRISIDSARYLTHDGSVVPLDYRCDVRIETAGSSREATISLNHPVRLGRWQIAQDRWLPDARSPTELIFTASYRPGLALVWTGSALIVAGMLYAFYVKPLVLRSREGTP